jgi:excisionase family DNA binding protein
MPADFDSAIELLTIKDAAEILTISVSSVRRLRAARQLPFVRIGGAVRFSKSDIVSYVERNRVKPAG